VPHLEHHHDDPPVAHVVDDAVDAYANPIRGKVALQLSAALRAGLVSEADDDSQDAHLVRSRRRGDLLLCRARDLVARLLAIASTRLSIAPHPDGARRFVFLFVFGTRLTVLKCASTFLG